MLYFWIAIIFGTLLLEIGHPSLFLFLSFSLGATAGLLADFASFDLITQILIFIITTLICILILRNVSYTLSKKETHTNMQALIGLRGVVIKEIAPNKAGQIKVNGEVWSARTKGNSTLGLNSYVLIERISGSHAFVTSIPFNMKESS